MGARMPPSKEKMEVKNWTVFGLLDQDFISNVKIACVFGEFVFKCVFLEHLIYMYKKHDYMLLHLN